MSSSIRPFLAWLLAAAGLGALVFATYRRALEVPFLWDDEMTIVANPRLEQLWPFGDAGYAVQSTEGGRPVARFTLALNHALGGLAVEGEGLGARLARSLGVGGGALAVRGYHLFNLAVHLGCGLLLLAVVRRTLERLERWRSAAGGLALAIASLWLVHPLSSEAVTYVSQRTELLMACAYLATLYASLRALDGPGRSAWSALAVLTCLLGMASKESMASAPLAVVLYDRAFAFPSLRAAWARRWPLYAGLAASWLVLAALIATGPRDESVGFGLGVAWWEYAVQQVGILAQYFRLALVPDELCFDYGTVLSMPVRAPLAAWLGLALALGATLWALGRRPAAGFLPALAFLVLAPSSSIVPIVPEVGAERRMYLPLAALVVGCVLGLHVLAAASTKRAGGPRASSPQRTLANLALVLGPVLVLLALATARRLEDYRSSLSIWRDAAAKRPDNPRARNHVGRELLFSGRAEEALAEFAAAMDLPGCEIEAFHNAGHALTALERPADAHRHFEELLRANPLDCRAHEGLGTAALELQDWAGAEATLRRCLELGCGTAGILNNLGKALFFLGRRAEAVQVFEEALALDPGDAGVAENLRKVRELLGAER